MLGNNHFDLYLSFYYLRSRRLKGNFKRGSVTLIATISFHSISQYIVEIKNLGLGYSQDVYLKRWMCAKLVNRISYVWLYKIQSNRNSTDYDRDYVRIG